jgi:tRNA A-37 threonylcarbamoyl transferase component Bud32
VKNRHALNINTCLKGIKNSIKHLHRLELVHYNINPINIIINREESIIINFDSCRPMGEQLELKAGTKG